MLDKNLKLREINYIFQNWNKFKSHLQTFNLWIKKIDKCQEERFNTSSNCPFFCKFGHSANTYTYKIEQVMDYQTANWFAQLSKRMEDNAIRRRKAHKTTYISSAPIKFSFFTSVLNYFLAYIVGWWFLTKIGYCFTQ